MDAKQIEQMSLFSALDKREQARVAQHADEVDEPEGKRLAREGDLAYDFFGEIGDKLRSACSDRVSGGAS